MRRLFGTVYLPATMYGIGQGAAAPVMALVALDLGASTAAAGLAVAGLGPGQVLGDTFAGQIVARIGERRSVVLAGTAAAVGCLACLLSPTLWLLAAGILLVGTANAIWGLARQNYLSPAVSYFLLSSTAGEAVDTAMRERCTK